MLGGNVVTLNHCDNYHGAASNWTIILSSVLLLVVAVTTWSIV